MKRHLILTNNPREALNDLASYGMKHYRVIFPDRDEIYEVVTDLDKLEENIHFSIAETKMPTDAATRERLHELAYEVWADEEDDELHQLDSCLI